MNLKNISAREQLKSTFLDVSVGIQFDLFPFETLQACYIYHTHHLPNQGYLPSQDGSINIAHTLHRDDLHVSFLHRHSICQFSTRHIFQALILILLNCINMIYSATFLIFYLKGHGNKL